MKKSKNRPLRGVRLRWKRIEDIKNRAQARFFYWYLPSTVIDSLISKDVVPAGASIIIFDRQINHLIGTHKPVSKRIPPKWLADLPAELEDYQAILLHKDDLVFVLKESTEGKNARAVVLVNFKRKGAIFNSVRSLGTVPVRRLRHKGYELIDGEL